MIQFRLCRVIVGGLLRLESLLDRRVVQVFIGQAVVLLFKDLARFSRLGKIDGLQLLGLGLEDLAIIADLRDVVPMPEAEVLCLLPGGFFLSLVPYLVRFFGSPSLGSPSPSADVCLSGSVCFSLPRLLEYGSPPTQSSQSR